MKKHARLSSVLHALLHLADQQVPMTSEAMAACLDTNPVVVRRTMAGLREAGLVSSGRGHGGGWKLARPLAAITLRDVYAALGEAALPASAFAAPDAQCLLVAAVNETLGQAYQAAEQMLLTRLGQVTLDELFDDAKHRHPAHLDKKG